MAVAEDLPSDATLIMEVLFDIRRNWRKTMGKKKRETPEERAARKARGADLDRRLREAIERRKAEAAERRKAAGG